MDSEKISKDIVLLDYDDETEEWTPFPPDRTYYAEIVRAFSEPESRTNATFFDIFFFDPFGRQLDEQMAEVFTERFTRLPELVDISTTADSTLKGKMYEAYELLSGSPGSGDIRKATEIINKVLSDEGVRDAIEELDEAAGFFGKNADLNELAPDRDIVLSNTIEKAGNVFLAQIVNNREPTPYSVEDVLFDQEVHDAFARLIKLTDRTQTEKYIEVQVNKALRNMQPEDFEKLLEYSKMEEVDGKKPIPFTEKELRAIASETIQVQAQIEYALELNRRYSFIPVTESTTPYNLDDILLDQEVHDAFSKLIMLEDRSNTNTHTEALLAYVMQNLRAEDYDRLSLSAETGSFKDQDVIPFSQEVISAISAEAVRVRTSGEDRAGVPEHYSPELINTELNEEQLLENYRELINIKPSIKQISENAAGMGYVKPEFQEYDGTIRAAAPVSYFRGRFYPHIDMMLVMNYLDVGPEDLEFYEDSIVLKNCRFPGEDERRDTTIPLYRKGTMLVNWAGRYYEPGQFNHRSFKNAYYMAKKYNVIKKKERGEELNPVEDKAYNELTPGEIQQAKDYITFFKGKVSMTGLTAAGTHDLNPIPYHPRYPLVGMHANMANTIINHLYVRTAPFHVFMIILPLLGLTLGYIGGRARQLPGALATLIAISGYGIACQIVFNVFDIWLPFIPVLFALILTYLLVVLYRFATEGQEARRMKQMFGTYVNPSLVDVLIQNPEMLQLGGERMDLSAMFALAKGPGLETHDAEELVDRLNEYFNAMTEQIFKYDGTLDKYEGSIIMAVFGAPVHFEDHPEKACLACADMKKALAELEEKWKQENKEFINMNVGMNSGPMIAGNMGSASRFNYTVMGDSVNLAARILGVGIQYNICFLISEYMYDRAKDKIIARLVDSVIVIGKEEPVKVYEIMASKEDGLPDREQEFVDTYEEAYSLYCERKWDEAIKKFEKAIELNDGDQPSTLMIERCTQYRETPPPEGWQGEYRMTAKGL